MMLLALLDAGGCARPAALQSGGSAPAGQKQVPFHDEEGKPPDTRASDLPATQDNSASENGLPFHDPQNLPAGTLLTVRLKSPISAGSQGARGTFEAVVDEPVVIEGNKLIPRGAVVAGRVESARTSNLKRNRGYLRLALDSIRVRGLNLPVQTSSLFVRGNAGEIEPHASEDSGGSAVIHLEKGHRLTFRLTETVYVAASQRTVTER
jgi:hypothetical protein